MAFDNQLRNINQQNNQFQIYYDAQELIFSQNFLKNKITYFTSQMRKGEFQILQ
ncbi:hypothetical protein pb186bvf_007852 [Paramecium bursaria]